MRYDQRTITALRRLGFRCPRQHRNHDPAIQFIYLHKVFRDAISTIAVYVTLHGGMCRVGVSEDRSHNSLELPGARTVEDVKTILRLVQSPPAARKRQAAQKRRDRRVLPMP